MKTVLSLIRPWVAPCAALSVVFALLLWVSPSEALSAEWTATVKMSKRKSERVKGLRFKKTVKVKGSKAGLAPTVKIRGKFKRRGWGLYRNKRWLVKRESSRRAFTLKVPLTGEETIITLKAVSPRRKVRNVKVRILFPAWAALETGGEEDPYEEEEEQEEEEQEEEETAQPEQKRTAFWLSLGGSSIGYTETGVDDFTMIGVTGKASFSTKLSQSWDFAINSFFTLLTLSSSRSDVTARYIGANFRLRYDFVSGPQTRFGLLGGIYYTTMQVTENAFGFKNMFGPTAGPVLSHKLASGNSIMAYAKYAIITGLTFNDREIAAGGGYITPLSNGHPLGYFVDFSDIAFDVDDTTITSTSISLSIGYGL